MVSLSGQHRQGGRWLREGAFAACSLIARVRPDPPVPPFVILSYHGHGPGNRWSVRIRDFERQVAFLAARFRLVRLSDLPDHLDHRARPTACLTFDDGYLDHYELTLPVLERFGVRATFFLAPALLGGRLRTGSREEPLMSVEQAREIVSRGHEAGSHTLTHAVLTEVPPDRAQAEIADSRRRLEDVLGAGVASFAYPKGRSSPALRSMVREAGYRLAATTRAALIPVSPDWFALPRVPVHGGVGPIQFRAQITHALDVYNRLRGRPK